MKEHAQWFPGHLRELSRAESLELIDNCEVGRVAYCDAFGPVVLPVNHVLAGEDILLRISPQSSLAQHLRDGPASFEVDEYDPYTQSGWSVLVRGMAAWVPYDELSEEQTPTPWVEGERTFNVRITPASITGRRLVPA